MRVLGALAIAVHVGVARGQESTPAYLPPKLVSVLPVFLVPRDEAPPTEDQKARVLRHLSWAQERYRELLRGADTFRLAPREPGVIAGEFRGEEYETMPERAGPQFISEVLDSLGLTRFNAPYSFFIVVMNHRKDFPGGGGRTLNGAFNTGAGMVEVSSWSLDHSTNFQSTIQHELGHSFGLPHVDAYGYSITTNASLMSYDQAHHTRGFIPSATPGILIPEDVRALALNHRVFPHLTFDAGGTCRPGTGWRRSSTLDPQTIPGQPPYEIRGTTQSGEAYGSSLDRMLLGEIRPSQVTTNRSTFDEHTMWHSDEAPTGWVSCDLTFPVTVTLTRIAVYSEHSGQYHRAHHARVLAKLGDDFHKVASRHLPSADSEVDFPATRAKVWRLELQAGPSRVVVLRGLRFFQGEEEILPRRSS